MKPADAKRVRAALRQTFGLARLRPGQQAVIERVMAGLHTLAVMPTGAGKSLCYQLPAVLLPGRTVVVSPLIALMKDQCDSLQALGVAAVQVHSAQDAAQASAAEAAVADATARVVMTTPEQLAQPAFLELLARHPVSLLAIDEAHCISQWGHDFRPAFLDVSKAWESMGKPTVLALTATASDEVVHDVCEQFRVPRSGVLNTGSYRPNLDLCVETVAKEEDKLARVVALVHEATGPGIVYAATIKAAEAVHQALLAGGESAGLYHGKLPAAERHAQQEAFMHGQHRVMVATNAFGLGIDKQDIRFVLHYQLPPRLESYYQEAGRAGRDGQPARCTLLFLRGDKAVQQFFMAGRYPAGEDAAAIHEALRDAAPDGQAWTLPLLQGRLARPRGKLRVALGHMRREGVIAEDAEGSLRLLRRDMDHAALVALMDTYAGKRTQDRDALEQMVFYAQTGQCRWRLILQQMDGGAAFARCGHCDNCRRIAAHEEAARQADPGTLTLTEEEARDTCAWKRGDTVQVRRYGRGVVELASPVQVTVRFPDGSTREFLPEYVARGRPAARTAAQRLAT